MFKLTNFQVSYSDPWLIPLPERRNYLNTDKDKVVYYYDEPDNSTFRYRVYNMMQALNANSENFRASFISYNELDSSDWFVQNGDYFVICRSKYSQKLSHFISRLHNKGKKVYFDVDDLVFEPSFVHLILDTLDQDFSNPNLLDFWHAYVGRIRATLELCDTVITTNPFLSNVVAEWTGKESKIIPNFLNKEQMSFSETLFNVKRNEKNWQHPFLIGYFSGTPSHQKDLGLIKDALIKLMKKNPNVNLRVVGFMSSLDSFRSVSDRIEFIPLQDFINLQRHIAETDLNVVPLQENTFTNCKSELKLFESGIVGTPTLASPTYIFEEVIKPKENGFLSNDYEWFEIMDRIVGQEFFGPNIYEKVRNYSIEHYGWKNQISVIEKVLLT